MSKVLISFLGTGPSTANKSFREYRTAEYVFENPAFRKTTSFVTAAIAEYIGCEKIIVLGTPKSMWEEYYRYFSGLQNSFDEDFYYKLGSYSEKANHLTNDFPFREEFHAKLPDTSIIVLKYGINEIELRHNLEQILRIDDLLEANDEVYVDVTHGFRSFPLFAQQIILYLKQVSQKNIEIRKFYYGMLDATKDLGYTPVVDLTVIQRMNDWIMGAGMLINKSDGSLLVKLLNDSDKELSVLVDNFSKALNINYSHEIRKQYQKILKADFSKLDTLEKTIALKAFDEFKTHFRNIRKSHSLFQLDLASWYYQKKLYGVAYLTLTEAIVTYFAEQGNPEDPLAKDVRDEVKVSMHFIDKELHKLYITVNKIRKNVAHMLDKRHDSYLNDINGFEKRLKLAYQLMNKID